MAARLYGYAVGSELIPLYPVYALLFAESGLSTAEISSLLVIWSITGFVLEVPSGVVADVVSRRLLLTISPLLGGAGFALWVLAPSYPAFAAGFVLWGAQGALQSGALEALVHDELERLGRTDRYAQLLGRSTTVGMAAAGLAMALAVPVFDAGGYVALGAASVLVSIAAAVVATGFPEDPRRARPHAGDDEPAGVRAYGRVVRAGLAEVRGSRRLRAALLAVPAVAAIWGALDEYLALLAVETGLTTGEVPLAAVVVYAGVAAGGALAGAAARRPAGSLTLALALAAAALAAGALLRVPAGFVLIAVAFAVFQALTVVADARLQGAIDSHARATVTSLAALATEVAVLGVYAGYALGSAFADHATLFAVGAGLSLLVLPAVRRGLDDRG